VHAPLPLLDPLLWLRALTALALVAWLPGHLVVGRWLEGRRPFDRLVLAVAGGLCLPFLYHAGPGRLGLPLAPWTYLPFVALLAGAAQLVRPWRRVVAAWTAQVAPAGAAGRAAAGVGICLGLLVVLLGQGTLPAPPHVHDASNHAWITLRVVEAESLDPAVVVGDGPGFLDLPYAPGIHATAALTARLGGVAPYVAVWMVTLAVLVLVPVAWALLWRAFGLPATAAALGLLLATANPLGPAGILNWGGFGQVAGFLLVPAGALSVAAVWRRPGPAQGLAAGALLGGIAFVHFSEVLVALGAAVLVAASAGGTAAPPRPTRRLVGLTGLLLGATAVAAPELGPLARAYGPLVVEAAPGTKAFGDALERLWRAGGRDLHQALLPLGYGFALARRRSRTVAVVGLLLGAWYLALQSAADPLSRALARPFYGQAPRILYLQFYIVPPLMALPLLALHRRLAAAGRARLGRAAVALLLATALGLGLPRVVEVLRSGREAVPFTADDFRQAVRVGETVPAGEAVANFWDDGSSWAKHVSGTVFLAPAAWAMRGSEHEPFRVLLPRLREDPWPAELARLLARDRVRWLYVSDTVYGDGPDGIRRADFDGDPRFVPAVVGKTSTLYRIVAEPRGERTGQSGG
jgi:hypothetical protein